MAVAGQPKTTSEYIQATSRVGRSRSTGVGFAGGDRGVTPSRAKPRAKPWHDLWHCALREDSRNSCRFRLNRLPKSWTAKQHRIFPRC